MKTIIFAICLSVFCHAEYSITPQPAANGVVINSMKMEFTPRLWTTVKYCPIVTTTIYDIALTQIVQVPYYVDEIVSVTENELNVYAETNDIFEIVVTNQVLVYSNIVVDACITSTTLRTVYTYPEISAQLDSAQSEALSKLTHQQLGIGVDPVPFAVSLDAVIRAGMGSIGMGVTGGALR
jgi:hypothetical protein